MEGEGIDGQLHRRMGGWMERIALAAPFFLVGKDRTRKNGRRGAPDAP